MGGTLLLFDVDGTLLRSGGAGMRAMKRVAADLYGDRFVWDGIETAGSLDPLIFAEAAALNGLPEIAKEHQRFRAGYLRALAEELDRGRAGVVLLPGVRPLLDALRRRVLGADGVTMGLLTGNYAEAVGLKFAAVGLDPAWFAINAFGDEAPTRPDLVALALRRCASSWGVPADSRRVVVIGDTPRDVACARAHGCVSFAVATGGHGLEQLRAAGAEHAVSDLADPAPLLDLLD